MAYESETDKARRMEAEGWVLNRSGEWAKPDDPDALSSWMTREDGTCYSSYFNNAGTRCFVATAVYGDVDAPEVVALRKFRDETLSQTALGRAAVDIYYSGFGKAAARILETHLPSLMPLIRKGLDRVAKKYLQ